MKLLRDRRLSLLPTHPPLRRSGTASRAFVPCFAVLLVSLSPHSSNADTISASGKITPDFTALAKQALLTLPPPPPWDATRDAKIWAIDDVKAEFAKITDTPPRVNFLRSKLLLPEHSWLLDFRGWFRSLQKPLKVRFEGELWDCDDYANCFVAFADLLALKAGDTRGSFCIGWATVYYRNPFAGIRAGGAHAVVIVGTSKGLYVLEPQDGTMIALKDFPNRHTIEDVYF